MNNWPSMFSNESSRPSGKGRLLTGDVEGMGLFREMREASDFHVITLKDYETTEVFVFFDPEEKRKNPTPCPVNEGTQSGYIHDAVKMLMESEAFCFQNGVGYDWHVFERCFPWFKVNYLQPRMGMKHYDIFPFKAMDSMIVSQLLNPDRRLVPQAYAMGLGATGPHSIAAHGIRMGRYKPDYDDWSTLTDGMIHRNVEDVEIGEDMLRHLMKGEWAEQRQRGVNPRTKLGIADAYAMELQVAMMITRQANRGFRFDVIKALSDFQEIDKEMSEIAEAVAPFIPLRLETNPYSFKELEPKYKAAIKGWVGDLDIDEGPREALKVGQVKAIYNGIHGVMKAKEAGRIGDKATCWSLTKKNGDYTANLHKYFPEMRGNINDTKDPLVAGPFTPLTFEEMGLGSLDYIKEKVLYPIGWRGVNLSDSEQEWMDENGDVRYPWSGKIDEDSMNLWKENGNPPEWAIKIVSYYVLRSRRSVILNSKDVEYFHKNNEWPKQKNGSHSCRGLLARSYNKAYDKYAYEYFQEMRCWPSDPDEDWRVSASAFSIGTNTFRMRHRDVVNIPARGLRPLRHLFIASKGKMVLGCDGAGLELRMLAHFMDDPEYQDIILNGDIHTHNMIKAGIPSRDIAKTFIYAFLYGSGIPGLARTAGMSIHAMRDCVERFKAELPALASLIERIEEAGRKFGYLQAIDGRWGRIRRSGGKLLMHTALNVLLQMTGSLVMKYGECMAEDQMIAEGVALDENGWPAFIANVHDEVQMEVEENEVEEYLYELPYLTAIGVDEKKAIKQVWDSEEKRQMVDDEGRIWSAPDKLSASNGIINVRRRYHRAGHILADNFAKVGNRLNMRCPLAGEYKVGYSWHDTH